MNIIDKFGNMVSSATLKDSEKARRLLLAGYRLQEKRLCLFPDRALPSSGRYVAKIVMKNIIQAHFLCSLWKNGNILNFRNKGIGKNFNGMSLFCPMP